MNNNQMQRELYNNMFRSRLYIYMFQLHRPFKRAAMMLMWPSVKML